MATVVLTDGTELPADLAIVGVGITPAAELAEAAGLAVDNGVAMEYTGYVEPGGYDRVLFRGDPTVRDGTAPQFLAFWVAGDRVLAGMDVNVWDVIDPIQDVVRSGHTGHGVDLTKLADPHIALGNLLF
jgi:NADPH-dependent 2,4-dienoyl-CoA reductase/sulfur reductase-like enzyme